MRYIVTLFVCISLCAQAQPAFELGLNAGAVLPTDNSNTGYIGSMNADILTGRFKHTFTPAFGVRSSVFVVHTRNVLSPSGFTYPSNTISCVAFGLPVSVNYTPKLSENTRFRLCATAAPTFDLNDNAGNEVIFLITEASAGIMFSNKLTTGVKYSYATGSFGTNTYQSFRVHTLQFDVRFMIPRGKVIEGKSQWVRLNERHKEIAVRHQKAIEIEKQTKERERHMPGKGPHLELGITTGAAFTNRTGNPTDLLFLITVDAQYDRHPSPFSFMCGSRAGVVSDIPGIGFYLGTKYEPAEQKAVRPRVSLNFGGWILDNTVKFTSVQFNAVSELSAGVLLGNRVYIGANYFQPFFHLEKGYMPSSSYIRFYNYNVSAIAVDLKVRMGKR